MTNERADRRAFVALISGALCIAFAPILVRESVLDPVATAFYRMFLSLPLFALWAALEDPYPSRDEEGETRRNPVLLGLSVGGTGKGFSLVVLLVASGLFFAGDLAVWHWSIELTSVANATLLANLAPVFVTAYAWAVLHERVSSGFLVGLFLALAGAALLARASLGAGGQHLAGDALGLFTAVFYAGYLLTVKELRRRLPTARLMAASSLVSAVALLFITVLAKEGLRPGSARGWLILFALAWLAQVIGQGLIAYGLLRLPASFSAVTLLVQPAAAALLAWALLGEALSGWQVLGGAAVIGGIVLARRATQVPGPPRAAPVRSSR